MFDRLVMGSSTSAEPLYVEDVFSTYLYTGTGTTSQVISNQINLSGQGGLVWAKYRGQTSNHYLVDSARGVPQTLGSNITSGQSSDNVITAFNNNGFTAGTGGNQSGQTMTSWTFRKAPKFFDVVTYTGNGVNNRTISHSLGITPGCIMIKRTDSTSDWSVYHRSVTNNNQKLVLNSTAGVAAETDVWGFASGMITSSVFAVGSASTNTNGATYVAYLFAHDTAADGIIQCGSFTTDASFNATVNLGWEPQWLLIKESSGSGFDWNMFDNMRGCSFSQFAAIKSNTNGAEFLSTNGALYPTATGFINTNVNSQSPLRSSQTHIYIAIRRGPMKTPTSGTSVFSPALYFGDGNTNNAPLTAGFPVDMFINVNPPRTWNSETYTAARILGNDRYLDTSGTPQIISDSAGALSFTGSNANMGITFGSTSFNGSGVLYIQWNFRRAPGFFDVVRYTGDGTNGRQISHNLQTIPGIVIVKNIGESGTAGSWYVWANGSGGDMVLNSSAATTGSFQALYVDPNSSAYSSVFNVNNLTRTANASAATYIAYLFGSCPGVSKVGSYTGNGSSQTIDCGFAAGARFVLIKRVDASGEWYVWDTARGISFITDPYLALNNSNASANDGSIDPSSVGFIINQTTNTNVNVSSASYIYLAIA